MLSKKDRQYIIKWGPFQALWLATLLMLTSGGPWFVILAAGLTWLYWLSAWKDEKKSCIVKKNGKIIWEVENEV